MEEWRSADERNSIEKITRARQAAEELFKPAPHIADEEPPRAVPPAGPTTEQQPKRQPRIFTVPPRLPPSPKIDLPATAAPSRRKAAAKEPRGTVPPSQVGRVRTLATYGMTTQQVAELYGVSVEEIDRILKTPVYSNKGR